MTTGVEVVTDRTALVHVSGHPRRAEMAKMYAWIRPRIAVPAHGEPLHLSEHAAFAIAQGAPQVLRAFDGDLIRLAPGDVAAMGRVASGRRLKDGAILCRRTRKASASAAGWLSQASSQSRSR